MTRPEAARGGPRLHIDWTRCEGRGLCVELLPEVLDSDPWGYPIARPDPGRAAGDPSVPAALSEYLDAAIEACPRVALSRRHGG
jgi:ferredoxin